MVRLRTRNHARKENPPSDAVKMEIGWLARLVTMPSATDVGNQALSVCVRIEALLGWTNCKKV